MASEGKRTFMMVKKATRKQRNCALCRKSYMPTGNFQKYCAPCGSKVSAEQIRAGNIKWKIRTGRLKNPGVGKGHAQGKGSNHHSYTTGISTYKKRRQAQCRRCASTGKLDVHHLDGNRSNNVTSNLETLCRSCHMHEHSKKRRDIK